jgi:transmembrane sensor
MVRRTAQEIDAEAAEWAARMDGGPLQPEQEKQFQAWLQDDVRCMGAYGRMRAIALTSERARALGPDFDPAAFISPPAFPRRRLLQLGGAVAASLLVAAGGAWQVLRMRGRFATGKGETKVVALKDGSVVTLNTASEIQVNYSDTLRGVELLQGEALFDVAKNRARPFVVTAGDTNVRAVGTSFTVRRLEEAPVQILVREGVVEVFKPASGEMPVRVSANSMAEAAQNQDRAIAARAVPLAQLQRQIAWQTGQIAFEGETLAQAAAEFARYSDTRIIIDDPALAREEITGLFKTTDPVGFAKKTAISLNLRVSIGEGEVRLSRQ